MKETANALEWYQQGLWPLIGAVALIVATNVASVVLVYIRAHASFRQQIKADHVAFLKAQLTEFYDPLLAFLATNQHIFNTLGPSTFPHDEIQRNAAGEIWQQAKSRVILKNNRLIASLLEVKSHLMHASDDLDNYLELFRHVQTYEIFQETSTDLYACFRFSAGIENHVKTMRAEIVKELKQRSGIDNVK